MCSHCVCLHFGDIKRHAHARSTGRAMLSPAWKKNSNRTLRKDTWFPVLEISCTRNHEILEVWDWNNVLWNFESYCKYHYFLVRETIKSNKICVKNSYQWYHLIVLEFDLFILLPDECFVYSREKVRMVLSYGMSYAKWSKCLAGENFKLAREFEHFISSFPVWWK